jgi:GT2 family glycosyltransferase
MWNYTIDHRIGFIEGKVLIEDWKSKKEMFAGLSFCLVKRRCLNEVGYFDKNFLIGEDLDWFVRLEYSGWLTAYCPDTNILHHRHKTIENSLGDKHKRYEKKRDSILRYKYPDEFLRHTLFVSVDRRLGKQKELLDESNEVI